MSRLDEIGQRSQMLSGDADDFAVKALDRVLGYDRDLFNQHVARNRRSPLVFALRQQLVRVSGRLAYVVAELHADASGTAYGVYDNRKTDFVRRRDRLLHRIRRTKGWNANAGLLKADSLPVFIAALINRKRRRPRQSQFSSNRRRELDEVFGARGYSRQLRLRGNSPAGFEYGIAALRVDVYHIQAIFRRVCIFRGVGGQQHRHESLRGRGSREEPSGTARITLDKNQSCNAHDFILNLRRSDCRPRNSMIAVPVGMNHPLLVRNFAVPIASASIGSRP